MMSTDFNFVQKINACRFNDLVSLEKHFDRVADMILNKVLLKVDKCLFRFTEIEFYFFREGLHEDPYIHKDDLQLMTGQWYFHGSGIDITFGDGINHGGILIRGIRNINGNENKFISGPLNVVKELFRSMGNIKIKDHVFCIDEAYDLKEERIVKAPRVGLGENAEEFRDKFYRYLIYPFEDAHKYKEKTRVAEAMLEKGKQLNEYSKEEINHGFKWEVIK